MAQQAKLMRIAATSLELNTSLPAASTIPNFIKMKDVPQVNAKTASNKTDKRGLEGVMVFECTKIPL
jgi:hypothetical protein